MPLVVLYGYKTWSLTLSEGHKLKLFDNSTLGRIFGLRRDYVAEIWGKIHSNLYLCFS
jgi:hypothetical protein